MNGSEFHPDGKLEQRVLAFLEKRSGSENIDKLALTQAQQKSEKADFFLNHRTVVCEVKALESDTKHKIDSILKPLMADEKAPVFYGAWTVEKILRHFPNGAEINREIFEAVTSAIQTLVRKANRQIRDTKSAFELPAAGGLLVIVNDLVEVVDPKALVSRVNQALRKRTPTGQLQFPEIQAVWILSETHVVDISIGRKAIPAFVLAPDESTDAAKLADALQPEWARAHGMPFIQMSPELSGTIEFKSATAKAAPKRPRKRQDVREEQYRQRPYLRRHSENELRTYFGLVMRGFAPGVLKGATPEDRLLTRRLLERWTHLLQEINERGTDMKTFGPDMREIGEQIRAGNVPRTTYGAVEAARIKQATIEVGLFYTNAVGESWRCLKVEGKSATVLLLSQVAGKTLEVVGRVDEPKWEYYWPVIAPPKLAALEQRYLRFKTRHPEIGST